LNPHGVRLEATAATAAATTITAATATAATATTAAAEAATATTTAAAAITATASAATAAAMGAFGSGLGFIHGQGTAVHFRSMQRGCRRLGFCIAAHFHEPEALASAGVPVVNDLCRLHGSVLCEQFLQL
jgi:cytoskeletal protein RodZ